MISAAARIPDAVSSYHKSLDFIYNLRGAEMRDADFDLRLERVAHALSLFGNPQDRFRVCHVAGTNGKGSTAAIIHSVLSAQRYRAGLYTSPHLADFTERIRVGRRPISRAMVVALVREVAARTEQASLRLTFFEFATVMAFVHFARQRVQAAVVEVGLGGRLDATNLVRPSVCAVTTIARDHERFLGKGIASIAREKGGIIKPGVPVVCGALPAAADRVIRGIARSREAPVRRWGRDYSVVPRDDGRFDYHGREWSLDGLRLSLPGGYQRHNAGVALASLETLRTALPVRERAIRSGLESVAWPGRLEVLPGRPGIILDGAHNPGAAEALAGAVPGLVGRRKVRLLFGSMHDKDWSSMLAVLCGLAGEVVLTRTPTGRSADPGSLCSALPRGLPATVVDDPVAALDRLAADRRRRDVPILVAGSLYLVGAVRAKALELSARFRR